MPVEINLFLLFGSLDADSPLYLLDGTPCRRE